MKPNYIPMGDTKEDVEIRKNIIKDFYFKWKIENPTQKLYNLDLKDYINIRYISIVETVEHGSKNYLSTLAVLQLDTILRLSKKVCSVNTKKTIKIKDNLKR